MRVSLIQQPLLWEDPAGNRRQFSELCTPLRGHTALVVLPEMFTTGFSMQSQSLAEVENGPSCDWMRAQAVELQSAVVGSVMTRTARGCVNRLLFAAPDGQFVHYDKRHLFRMGHEHEHYRSGVTPVVVAWRGMRIAPQVCYDLRFPVWSRRRPDYDYDLLLYVANWPSERSFAWRQLLIARAIENQCFVVGVNRCGVDGKGVSHSGDSAVHDFLGGALASLGDQSCVSTVELDLPALQRFRERFPAHLDADRFTLQP